MMNRSLFLIVAMMLTNVAWGEIRTETVEYKDGDVNLRGYVAYDDAADGRRPGVMVVHEWWGLDDYAKSRARQLAELGYVGFAVDMYGDGKTTDDPKQAGEWATTLRSDPQKLVQRATAGLTALKARDNVDGDKLAAIGYCFGGSTVLQLARSGSDLDAVVSFHGGLANPSPAAPPGSIKPTLLICHGAIDPMVKPAELQGFIDEMKTVKADYILMILSNADHSFTNPTADTRNIPGISYNQAADKRSWAAMKALFESVFAQ